MSAASTLPATLTIGGRLPSGMVCTCGSPDLIAIEPGHEIGPIADLFVVESEQPMRAFCVACWPFGLALVEQV